MIYPPQGLSTALEFDMDYVPRTPEQLGQVLRSSRRARHLTQTEVGEKAGQKQSTISTLETDSTASSIQTLYRVLSALGLELVIRDKQADAKPKAAAREW
jgi:HTH-type transcriptional regulator/antitoxin HipB